MTKVEECDGEFIEQPWKLNDNYKFSPESLEGDPWKKVLVRLLEKDKTQCEGWKEEVGNLLIFAGLFSAVVTAFVVESYQSLQPDSQSDIVSLLSHISIQLKDRGNETASQNIPSQTFSPDQSAVRVNTFWFLSLIFSLATVLIGITCLQWIREYQTYPGRSAREDVAMYHMRRKGMVDWHVWKILTALPLLLQGSLVLFFAGLVDFLNAIGNRAVLIAVTAAVGVILLFLVTTTTLPFLQSSLLYLVLLLPRRLRKPPSQCPYKSPQAAVISSTFVVSLRIIAQVLAIFTFFFGRIFKWSVGASKLGELLDDITSMNNAIRCRLSDLWRTKAWLDWDENWLWIRDTCSRILCDNRYDWNEDNTENLQEMIPLFDSVAVLRESKKTYNDKSIQEAYHCFADLSMAFTVSYISEQDPKWKSDSATLLQRNRYLRYVFRAIFRNDPSTFEDDLLWRIRGSASSEDIIKLLHDQNMFIYLDYLRALKPSKQYLIHREEIKIRIQQYLFSVEAVLAPEDNYPDCLDWIPAWIGSMGDPKAQQVTLVQQYMGIVKTFFVYISGPKAIGASGGLHEHPRIGSSLHSASLYISLITATVEELGTRDHTKAVTALASLFCTIQECLKESDVVQRKYILYCAAIYVKGVGVTMRNNEVALPSLAGGAYRALISEIQKYKAQIIDVPNGPDVEIEKRFEFYGPQGEVPFTRGWWSFLDDDLAPASTSSSCWDAGDPHDNQEGDPTSPGTESARPLEAGSDKIELTESEKRPSSSLDPGEYNANTLSFSPQQMSTADHHPSTALHALRHSSMIMELTHMNLSAQNLV